MKNFYRKMFTFFISMNAVLCFGQWQNTGPYGARMEDAVHVGTDTFVTTFLSPGIYKSSDNGNSWIKIAENLTPSKLFANGNSLYTMSQNVMYRSDDFGASWYAVSPQFPNIYYIHYIVHAGNYTFLFADKKVYRSENEGTTWSDWAEITNFFTAQNKRINEVIVKDDVIYVGAALAHPLLNAGFFRSEDFGATWQEINNSFGAFAADGSFINNKFPTVTAMTFHNEDLFAAVSPLNGVPQGLWKSADNGDSWTHVTFLNNSNQTEITSINGSLYVGTKENGFFKSDDNGENWIQISDPNISGYDSYEIRVILEGNDSRIFSQSYNNILVSDNNGINWEISNDGITSSEITSIISGDALFVGNNPGGIFRSSNNAETWEKITPPNGIIYNPSQIIEKLETIIVAKPLSSNSRYVSDDNGDTWHNNFEVPSNGAITESNGYLFKVAIGGGVSRSNDMGVTWEPANNGLPNSNISHIASFGNKLYVSSHSTGEVFQSVNNGDSWTACIGGYFPWGFNVTGIQNAVFIIGPVEYPGIYRSLDNGENFTFLAADGTVLVFENFILWKRFDSVSNSYHTFRSNDLGNTWEDVTNNFFPDNYRIVEENGLLFALSNNSLLLSNNEGANWVTLDTPPTPGISIIDLFISHNKLFLRTLRSGLWHRNLDDFTAPDQPGEIFGVTDVCANSIQTYSVEELPGFNITYNWQVPAGWEIVSGQGTNSITVNVGENSGVISVTASNSFGDSPPQTIFITVTGSAPQQPDPISGMVAPCINSTQIYSVNYVAGVDYFWTVPSGWEIVSGQGINTIEVIVGTDPGTIEVIPSNTCDSGIPQTLEVIVSEIPTNPGEISGPENPEPGTVQFYSVVNTPGVTYSWTVPSDWTIINGQGTNTIGVNVGTASGEVTCTPSNDCGTGESAVLDVTTTIGTTNFTNNYNITVYPNPSSGKINILFGKLRGETRIEITDMTGHKLFESDLFINADNFHKEYDLTGLTPGVYFIQVKNNSKTSFRKLIIK